MIKEKLYPTLQKIRYLPYIIIYKCLLIFKRKVDKNKIVIISAKNKKIEGNLEYIQKYLEENKKEYTIIKIHCKKRGIISKMKFYIRIIYNVTNAQYIFIDDVLPLIYVLKMPKNAKLIQVWHACGAFKKVGYSRKHTEFSKYSLTHRNYTDAIVSSEECINNYSEAFGLAKDNVHALGIPRTDMFFDEKLKNNIKGELIEEFKIKDKKIYMFAPTFRGNKINNSNIYSFEQWINIDKLYKNLKDNEIFIIKLHPFSNDKITIKEEYKDKIWDFSKKDININKLLLISDILITDYSSVIFEYSLLDKPIIFYIPDYDEYKESRDFYYDFSEYVYGDKCENMEELIYLLHTNKEVDMIKVNRFKEKFLSACDGKSTQRVVEYFLQEIKK